MKQIYYGNDATVTFNIPSNSRYLFISTAGAAQDQLMLMLYATSSGELGKLEVAKGTGVININISVNGKLTIEYAASRNRFYLFMPLSSSSGDITKQS